MEAFFLTAMQKLFTYILAKLLGLYINILSYLSPQKASRLAYKFFSEPRAGRLLNDQLPSVLKEAEAGMITHNDFVFQTYTWKGNDIKVLLVHGWESNASRWKLFITYLKKAGCTIIAVDAPAHGLSSGTEFNIPQYAEFLDIVVKKEQPQYMVGHSLGGATALYYQSHYPNTIIQKMVIMGAPCDFNSILHNYIGMLSLNSNVFRLLKKHLFDNFKIKTEEFSGSLFAAKIKIQGLIAHDKNDKTVAFKEGKKIAAAWPQAEFVETRGLGHSMHDDKLYTKIYSFLFASQSAEK
jgi:pimeloyl-ACP methyl ester carboxylesterase